MVSQKEHLQALIAEIDSVLQRTSPRLPWVMSGEVAQQRQVLERVRNYLVALQQSFSPYETGEQTAVGVNGLSQDGYPGATVIQSGIPGEIPADMTPYQMMQSILREVSYLRANLTPTALNQPPANQQQLTAELLQILMSRLQENLSHQIAQTLENLRNQPPQYGAASMLSGGLPPVPVPPQYDQLQTLRSRSDQMLVNLDSTLNVVFESLQRNIQAYQEALSQGLERMYNTGQQSEYTFKILIDQLVQQLKQEASAYLLASQADSAPPASSVEKSPPAQSGASTIAPAIVSPPTSLSSPNPAATPAVAPSPDGSFPYAGVELLSSEISGADLTTPAGEKDSSGTASESESSLDSAIESWLQSVSSMQNQERPVEEMSASFPPLDLSDLDLGTIDLEPTADLSVPALAIKEPAPSSAAPTLVPLPSSVAEPAAELPTLEPPPISPTPVSPSLNAEAEADTADIDAALKLLEDLSAELENSANSISLEDAEAQLEQMLEDAVVEENAPSLLPNDAQDELDEFYQSLFGSEQETPPTPSPLAIESIEPSVEPSVEPSKVVETQGMEAQSLTLPATLGSSPVQIDLQATTPDAAAQVFLPELELPAIADISSPFETAALAETQEEPLFLDLPADLFGEEPAPEVIAPAPTEPVTSELTPSAFEDTGSLTDLFQDIPEATHAIPTEPPVVRKTSPTTIGFLPTGSQRLLVEDDLFGGEFFQDAGEDQFTRAAPDEILLPDVAHEEGGISLELDDLTLNSLSEDLSSLEGSLGEPRVASPEFTLDDFAAGLVPTSEATVLPTQNAATPPTSIPTPFYQASSAISELSVEGFSDLFGSVAPAEPPPPLTVNSAEPLPFTLEEASSLFDEVVSPPLVNLPGQPRVADRPSLDDPSPFTLEGMDDLFSDAPLIDRTPASQPESRQASSSSGQLSQPALETAPTQPSAVVRSDAQQDQPFTLEGMDDLFGAASATEAAPQRLPSPRPAIPPFKPELYNPDDVVDPLPPFKLEQLDNLFVESSTPATNASSPSAESAIAPAPSTTVPDKQSLDAAFESLLGTPPPAANSAEVPNRSTLQKKKTS
ncbi:MAG: hypothetical protein NW224_12125 [Leptolyngbyaceae cyanobacterium bins.302]|nr:hypothetical protein [Leptolyngbyaceae cyanobacterium bins.302]